MMLTARSRQGSDSVMAKKAAPVQRPRKQKKFQMRINEDELLLFQNEAARNDMSVADWLRGLGRAELIRVKK